MMLNNVITVGKDSQLLQLAGQFGREVFSAEDINEALDIVKRANPELIIFSSQFDVVDVRKIIGVLNKKSNSCIVYVGNDVSGNSSQAFLDAGANYYLQGEKEYHKLNEIVNKINGASVGDVDVFFADELAASVAMVGKSKAALHSLKMIKLVAASQCNPVLIIGQTGTGKEVAARAVHNLRCSGQPFVAVNCAAMTANLLESELFGHVKGSFTSADREKTGLIELAAGGSIFLDEISEMPLDLQAKLLRVIQEKTFRKVGGTEEIQCKATIMASSNRNLSLEVQAKRFRADLYYRLDVCPITLAPLCSPSRREDIGLLAEYFLKTSQICLQKAGKIKSITKIAIESLQQHDWAGNIRQLKNVIERAILLENTDKIGLDSIVLDTSRFEECSDTLQAETIRDFSLDKAEKQLIARALQETRWQKTKAADLLGISRATLYAKVRQHSIEVVGDDNDNVSNQLPAECMKS
ncbi:MAG: sigma-54 dependent transcriptional regulator [Planctomycetaceae bacterium]|nr:sigma-54 dependent transcriptional regulator [Planctomycetaceae bacterium]